ncbi:hypothetical protein KSF_108270 [Reticulibacter mediterranei]|uniref:Uncharacterized protein n=2 Tax=Reticulibacter mediterranei TaxID=2778369 RepID=A0A8J3N735_9CHLR|nr:hypothetical protein KSF_108270 [Reticulibacter mediterranei]
MSFLLLGVLLQFGALIAPWLIHTGMSFFEGGVLFLLSFRMVVWMIRFCQRGHHILKQHARYREGVLLLKGTSLWLLQWICKGIFWLLFR